VCHLYAINEPHDGWVIQTHASYVAGLHNHAAEIESYEEDPPWGLYAWKCSDGHDQAVTVTPAFSDSDCEESLELLGPRLSAFCLDPKVAAKGDFEAMLQDRTAPRTCGYDCAHLFFDFSEACAPFLAKNHPSLAGFTAACTTKHAAMANVVSENPYLEAGGHYDKTFNVQQGLVYDIEEIPGEGLQRTGLAIEAPRSHHVLADRIDESKHGAGAHNIEWDAPQTKAAMEIHVDSLEGSGSFHLQAQIVGTSEKDAKLAQKLGQIQPFIAVSPQECMGQLAPSGPT
jgi:hypothetical protein